MTVTKTSPMTWSRCLWRRSSLCQSSFNSMYRKMAKSSLKMITIPIVRTRSRRTAPPLPLLKTVLRKTALLSRNSKALRFRTLGAILQLQQSPMLAGARLLPRQRMRGPRSQPQMLPRRCRGSLLLKRAMKRFSDQSSATTPTREPFLPLHILFWRGATSSFGLFILCGSILPAEWRQSLAAISRDISFIDTKWAGTYGYGFSLMRQGSSFVLLFVYFKLSVSSQTHK